MLYVQKTCVIHLGDHPLSHTFFPFDCTSILKVCCGRAAARNAKGGLLLKVVLVWDLPVLRAELSSLP
jgi:hypothetical protein